MLWNQNKARNPQQPASASSSQSPRVLLECHHQCPGCHHRCTPPIDDLGFHVVIRHAQQILVMRVARVASWQLVACWHRTSDEIGLSIVKGNRKKPPGVREGAEASLPPGSDLIRHAGVGEIMRGALEKSPLPWWQAIGHPPSARLAFTSSTRSHAYSKQR